MNIITKINSWDPKRTEQTVKYFIANRFTCYNDGSFEHLQERVNNAEELLVRLLNHLATRDLMNAVDLTKIVTGFADEDAKFTE